MKNIYQLPNGRYLFSADEPDRNGNVVTFDMERCCFLNAVQQGQNLGIQCVKASLDPMAMFPRSMTVLDSALLSFQDTCNPDLEANARAQITGIVIPKLGPGKLV